MVMLADRLARAALAGVLQELQDDPTGAADLLARLFGEQRLPAVAEGGQLEPRAVEQSAAAGTRGERRDEAAQPAPRRKRQTKASPAPEGEAVALVRQLEERHGHLRAAARVVGIHEQQLRRYRAGKQVPTLATLERLRSAVSSKGAEPGEDAPDLRDDAN